MLIPFAAFPGRSCVRIRLRRLTVSALFFLTVSCAVHKPLLAAEPNWQTKVQQELPLLGHRNWIVIVDSAYPLQTSAGVETIDTGAGQSEVVSTVLKELSASRHVAPWVYMDAELPFVPERRVPGVSAYRAQVPAMLNGLAVHSLPHMELIRMLASTGSEFHVLVLKSNFAIPYTSVFLRLDCKYWDDAAEDELRQAMKKKVPGGRVPSAASRPPAGK
jgi:hypothetical protein